MAPVARRRGAGAQPLLRRTSGCYRFAWHRRVSPAKFPGAGGKIAQHDAPRVLISYAAADAGSAFTILSAIHAAGINATALDLAPARSDHSLWLDRPSDPADVLVICCSARTPPDAVSGFLSEISRLLELRPGGILLMLARLGDCDISGITRALRGNSAVQVHIAELPDEVSGSAGSLDRIVPGDWGGERSDLYTSRLFARGRQVSAAWLFKGPGYPRAMDVKALGKNGDQIDRLFTEPAELLVLQHCHQIKPSVVGMMDAYAHDARRPRSYMIIDGADTGRILKSLGLLPVTPAHAPLQNQRNGNPTALMSAAAVTSELGEAPEQGSQAAEARRNVLRRRTDVLVRRPVSSLPKAQADSKPPRLEPVLDGQVFEHILGVIRMQARQMEQSPATYAGMGEEDRRQTIVATLNTHYSGRAHAEAFNNQGKTDILIRYEGRNLFICECKFWSGPEGFSKTIDQLFHYAGWRDTKLAIIMFVRQKALTSSARAGKPLPGIGRSSRGRTRQARRNCGRKCTGRAIRNASVTSMFSSCTRRKRGCPSTTRPHGVFGCGGARPGPHCRSHRRGPGTWSRPGGHGTRLTCLPVRMIPYGGSDLRLTASTSSGLPSCSHERTSISGSDVTIDRAS
jgi:hypothetical protein